MDFDVDISNDTFIILNIEGKGRKRKVCEAGWTNKVNEYLWSSKRLPCVWSFRQGNPRTNDVIAQGCCKVCAASLQIISIYNSVKMSVSIRNCQLPIPHDLSLKRRHMKTHKNNDYEQRLKDKSAYKVRLEMASEKMNITSATSIIRTTLFHILLYFTYFLVSRLHNIQNHSP